jgi:hypothetical protein
MLTDRSTVTFRARVELPDDEAGCWMWRGYRDPDGYGHFTDRSRAPLKHKVSAHRYAWELFHGTEPGAMNVCHSCDRPECVNPAHLFLGTAAENQHDKVRKQRQARGQTSGRAKLTDDHVRAIRAAIAAGESCGALAAKYGVTHAAIWWIKRGDHWKHVA